MLQLLIDLLQIEAKLDTIHRFAATLPTSNTRDAVLVSLQEARSIIIAAASDLCSSDDITKFIEGGPQS